MMKEVFQMICLLTFFFLGGHQLVAQSCQPVSCSVKKIGQSKVENNSATNDKAAILTSWLVDLQGNNSNNLICCPGEEPKCCPVQCCQVASASTLTNESKAKTTCSSQVKKTVISGEKQLVLVE